MKTLSAIAVMGLVACGVNDENATNLGKNITDKGINPTQNESEEQLGIVAKSSSMVVHSMLS